MQSSFRVAQRLSVPFPICSWELVHYLFSSIFMVGACVPGTFWTWSWLHLHFLNFMVALSILCTLHTYMSLALHVPHCHVVWLGAMSEHWTMNINGILRDDHSAELVDNVFQFYSDLFFVIYMAGNTMAIINKGKFIQMSSGRTKFAQMTKEAVRHVKVW